MKQLFYHYIPYGVIDVLVTVMVISQIIMDRTELIWANIPLLVLGIISLNRKIRAEADDPDA